MGKFIRTIVTAFIIVFCSSIAISQKINDFQFRKKPHFTKTKYHSSESHLFLYYRTYQKNAVLMKAGKKDGVIEEKELKVDFPANVKKYAQINSDYLNEQLVETYYCEFEEGKSENEFAIFILLRRPETLLPVAKPIEIYSFSSSEKDGNSKSQYAKVLGYNSWVFLESFRQGYFMTFLDDENKEVIGLSLNSEFEVTYKFDFPLNTDGSIQTYSLDPVYEVPYCVRYVDTKYTVGGDNKEGVDLVVNWLDVESEKFKETKLIVEKKYFVFRDFTSKLNLDDNQIRITQSFKNMDPQSENYTGSGIMIVDFNLIDGQIVSEKEIYVAENEVVSSEYLDLLKKYGVSYFENKKGFFNYFNNALNIHHADDGSFFVYSDHLISGHDVSDVQKTIYNSAYIARYDSEWNLIWSKFLPFDPSKYFVNNNSFRFFEDCIVLMGFNHLESSLDAGLSPTGKNLKKTEAIFYVIDDENGSIIQKRKFWSPKDKNRGIIHSYTQTISTTELILKVGETTKLVDFSNL
ncbi:MAG: hypothetical protein ACI857_000162 [Arenicella sp.]|jgi:hypothetical protein